MLKWPVCCRSVLADNFSCITLYLITVLLIIVFTLLYDIYYAARTRCTVDGECADIDRDVHNNTVRRLVPIVFVCKTPHR